MTVYSFVDTNKCTVSKPKDFHVHRRENICNKVERCYCEQASNNDFNNLAKSAIPINRFFSISDMLIS